MNHELDPAALRRARVSKGWSQTRLGITIGVADGGRISQWETGAATPRTSQLRSLSDALDVSIADLLKPIEDGARDLRRLRVEAGLAIAQLASAVNVAAPTLKRWEKGVVKNPVRAPVEALAAVLNVSLDVILEALDRTGRNA